MYYVVAYVLLAVASLIPAIFLHALIIRPWQMYKLAKEFGFSYKFRANSSRFFKSDWEHSIWNLILAKNLIEGKIDGHFIAVFDMSYLPRMWWCRKFNDPEGNHTTSRRHTMLIVDKKRYALQGKISGYYPVSGIREYLKNLPH